MFFSHPHIAKEKGVYFFAWRWEFYETFLSLLAKLFLFYHKITPHETKL